MPELYEIIARKIFSRILGGHVPPCPRLLYHFLTNFLAARLRFTPPPHLEMKACNALYQLHLYLGRPFTE